MQDKLVGVLLRQDSVLLCSVEAFSVPGLEVGGQEDRFVYVAVLEEVFHHRFFRVLLVLLHRPVILFGAELMVAVEALDPTLRVLLLALDPVPGTRVPVVNVPIYHKILLSIFLVQEISSPDYMTVLLLLQSAVSPLPACLAPQRSNISSCIRQSR